MATKGQTVTAPAGSYSFQSGGQTFIASPTAQTTAAQKAAVASNSAYTPVSAGTTYTAGGNSFTGNVNYNPTTGESTPIPLNTVTEPAQPIKLPTPAQAPAVPFNLADLTGSIASANTTQSTEVDTAKPMSIQDVLNGMANNRPQQLANDPGLVQRQNVENEALAEVNRYKGQLGQIYADTQAAQLSLIGQGRGVPEAIIGGQQAQIAREAAIKALPIQAALEASMGNLELAKDRLDSYFKIRSQDIQMEYQYNREVLNTLYNYADKQQERALAVKEKALDRELDMKKSNLSVITSLAGKALDNGNYNIAARFMGLDPQSPSIYSDMSKVITDVGAGVSGNIANTEYAGVISTILGSGKFTKDQTTRITNSIANGEDPLTVVKNQAKNLMTATNAGDVQKYEVARDTLSNVGAQLAEFYARGGDTGLIKGNFEKVINNLGNVTDPALVTLATQIQGNLQVYRNAISGTAYSEQEGRDIASIFPGINKSAELNTAILKGRSLLFDSVIDSNYKSVLGSAYDELKAVENKTNTYISLANGSKVSPDSIQVGVPFTTQDGQTYIKSTDGNFIPYTVSSEDKAKFDSIINPSSIQDSTQPPQESTPKQDYEVFDSPLSRWLGF